MKTQAKAKKEPVRRAPAAVVQRAAASDPKQALGSTRLRAMPVSGPDMRVRRAPAPDGSDFSSAKSASSTTSPAKKPPVKPKQRTPHQPGGTVCLTFDDGPYAETIGVLSVLNAEKVPAAFFMIGGAGRSKEKGPTLTGQ